MIRVVLSRNYCQPSDRSEYLAEPPKTGLLRDALDAETLHYIRERRAQVYRNGAPLEDPLEAAVAAGDWVQVVVLPGGIETIFIYVAIAVFSSLVMKALAPKLKPPQDRGDASSPTYSFGGISSNRTEGEPKALCYGKMRVGGQVVNEDVTFYGTGKSDARYAAQISLGEGPIKSIGGVSVDTEPEFPLKGSTAPSTVYIDGTPADTFGDAEVHVRLGTNEQLEMTSFRLTATEVVEVNTELTQIEDDNEWPSQTNVITYNTAGSVADPVLDAYAVQVDLDATTCDRARLVIEYPEGLYKLYGTQGDIVVGAVNYFVCYQELTAGGTPITTGGNFGDGWVRLAPFRVRSTSTSPFSIQFEFPFYDPLTYLAVSNGYMPWLKGDDGVTAPPDITTSGGFNGDAGWNDGADADELSASMWVHMEAFTLNDPGTDDLVSAPSTTILHLQGTGKGFTFGVRQRTFKSAPGLTADYWVPVLEINNGGTSSEIYELINSSWLLEVGDPTVRMPRQQMVFLAFTFKANVDGTKDRVRLYYQGELYYEVLLDTGLKFSTGDLTACSGVYGFIDELQMYQRELRVQEISDAFNGGFGTEIVQDETKLVMKHGFDSISSSFQLDTGPLSNHFFLSGNLTPVRGFVFQNNSSNSTKVSRWRVRVMRNLPETTHYTNFTKSVLGQVVGLLDERFSYPNEPLIGLRVHSSDSLSGSIPNITALVEGRLVPIWDQGDATNPTFVRQYSSNPAWVACDILLDKFAGLGNRIEPADIDVVSFLEWADYCDEQLYDNRGDRREGYGISAAADAYRDLLYESTVSGSPQFSGRGRIRVRFGNVPPAHWRVGGYVAWSGEFAASGFVDTNYGSGVPGGYEIESIHWQSPWWIVDLYYDRLGEGEPWTDGGYLSSEPGFPAGGYLGMMEGREVRFSYDGVIDKAESAWDVLLEICSTARAICVVEGNRVRVRVQKPRTPVALVGQAQVLEGSFEVEWEGFYDRPNVFTVRFHDEELDYERSEARYEHPSVANSADNSLVREGNVFARGITRRSQALRHAKYTLNQAEKITISGSFEVAPDGLFFEVGDVIVLAHDLMPWGDSGRLQASGFDQLVFDRAITIEAATTHYVRVRNNATGEIETGTLDTGTLVPGTYAAGNVLPLSANLTFSPEAGSPYVHYREGDEFLAEVVDLELTADMKVRVSWANYDETIYEDEVDGMTAIMVAPSGGMNADQDRRPPPNVTGVRVRAGSRKSPSGTDEPVLYVGWKTDDDGARGVERFRIWTRICAEPDVESEGGEWILACEVDSNQRTAICALPAGTVRRSYAVAVQPVSRGGAKQPPALCAKGRCHVLGLTRHPGAASGFSAQREGAEVVLRWSTATADAGCVAEIRVGGWALGQLVASAPPGTQEVRLLAVSEAAEGTAAPVYSLRLRTPAGRFSASVETTVADAVAASSLAVREDTTHFFSDQAWELFGTGWTRVSFPTTTLTGLQVTAGELEFSGSDLVAYWQSPNPAENTAWKPETYFLEAFVVGRQVHPSTWEETTWAWGDEAMGRLLWEGPSDQLELEPAKCSVLIEVSWKEASASSWTAWTPYRPGYYTGLVFRWRLTVSRSSASQQVKIERFSTRISRAPRARWEQTPHQARLLREVLS